MAKRLTSEDWVAAGFRALAGEGPGALRAEALARALGTTKGSFYWHFKDVPAFKGAMLSIWKDKAATAIIEALAPLPTPEARLRELAVRAGEAAPSEFGGRRSEPALRAWALADPVVAEGVQDVDRSRIAYLREQLIACGRDPDHALVIYGAYVGLDDLSARGEPRGQAALRETIELVLRG